MAVAREKVPDMARVLDLCNQEDSTIEVPNLHYYVKQAKKLYKKESVEELFWLKKKYAAFVKGKGFRAPSAFNTKNIPGNQGHEDFFNIQFCYAKNND